MQVTQTIEVPQEIDGEAAALTQGVHAAVRMLQAAGNVTPSVIALVRQGDVWRGIWQMDITDALKHGNEGLQELGLFLSRVVGPTGCDMGAFGMAPAQSKADAVVIVIEGKATGGPEDLAETEWRSLSIELRTDGHACGLLYRVLERPNEVALHLVGRTQGMTSPLDQHSGTRVLH